MDHIKAAHTRRCSEVTRKTYKSDLAAVIHDNARALYEIGAIDKKTMREFDESCLTPVRTFTGEQIKALRERECVSQPVFASYLNVTKGMVSAWERGAKSPSGPALRLLSLVDKKGLEAIS
jgi:putative transcriptional regulator